MEWQPIETAPKDGTAILAVMVGNHPETGAPYIPTVSVWDDEYNTFKDALYSVDELLDMGITDIGGWNPTHWMPLPEPPKAG